MDRNMNQTMRRARGVRGAWRAILWGALALVLLLPAVAMEFTPEVDWSLSDFLIMGALLAALGLGIEAAVRFLRSWGARLIAIGAVLAMFLLIWIELAVGVFGTPFAGS